MLPVRRSAALASEATMSTSKRIAAAAFATLLAAAPAAAHHGWAWVVDEQSELTGTVVSAYYGNPHTHLSIMTDEGVWEVDLAPPGASARAGFVEGIVEPGDMVTLIGNRSRDNSELRMKAVRVIVGDEVYDVYPDRI